VRVLWDTPLGIHGVRAFLHACIFLRRTIILE